MQKVCFSISNWFSFPIYIWVWFLLRARDKDFQTVSAVHEIHPISGASFELLLM
jgi:hypothetical protein